MTVTRYRKGVLSVPKLYVDEIDTFAGQLSILFQGLDNLALVTGYAYTYQNLRIGQNRVIEDYSGGDLLGSDNSGHINTLARIDTAVTSESKSDRVHVTASEIADRAQSGTFIESEGTWRADADDIFFGYLGALVNRIRLKGAVKIETITLHMKSVHVDAYVTAFDLYEQTVFAGTQTSIFNSLVDVGNGDVLATSEPYDVNATLEDDKTYFIRVDCEATAGAVYIYGITVEYQTT